MDTMETKPIFLLADSQLLFLKNQNQQYYLQSIADEINVENKSCAYIGASNGDDPQYFELFKAAMSNVGLFDCKMITASFNEDEREFLEKAGLILLAGGDTELGLQVIRDKGIEEILQRRYHEGVVLVGVSAGAVQLGWQSVKKAADGNIQSTDGLRFIPFMVLVHVEKENLGEVESILKESPSIKRAYEIPSGGGLIFHIDYTVEAIRKPINEFVLKDETFMHTLIYPVE